MTTQQPGTLPAEMTDAFGRPLSQERAWCNLCRAEGREFEIVPDSDWLSMMEKHTRLDHPEHQAMLDRGETYKPVEVAL